MGKIVVTVMDTVSQGATLGTQGTGNVTYNQTDKQVGSSIAVSTIGAASIIPGPTGAAMGFIQVGVNYNNADSVGDLTAGDLLTVAGSALATAGLVFGGVLSAPVVAGGVAVLAVGGLAYAAYENQHGAITLREIGQTGNDGLDKISDAGEHVHKTIQMLYPPEDNRSPEEKARDLKTRVEQMEDVIDRWEKEERDPDDPNNPNDPNQVVFPINPDNWDDISPEDLAKLIEATKPLYRDPDDGSYQIRYYDPVVLDLNGDGVIDTINDDGHGGAMFDHNDDGFRTATGWVSPDDGILVRDMNGNGTIDTGAELFGDNTLLADGSNAHSGMQALAELDSNVDGIIDNQDTNFNELKVWQDKNSDGISTTDELISLVDAGISNIDLTEKQTINQGVEGGFVKEKATFTKTDGSTAEIADINFDSDAFHSNYKDTVAVSENISELPYIGGIGRLANIHQSAMKSDKLADLLDNYSKITSRDAQKIALDEIMLEWASTDPQYINNDVEIINHETREWHQSDDSSNIIWVRRGEQIPEYLTRASPKIYANDEIEAQIKFSEAFLGKAASTVYYQLAKFDQVEPMIDNYTKTKEIIYDSFLTQTILKPYVDELNIANGDFTAINELIEKNYQSDMLGTLEDLKDLMRLHSDEIDDVGWYQGFTLLQTWRDELSAMSDEIKATVDEMFIDFDYTAESLSDMESNSIAIVTDETLTDVYASDSDEKIIINTESSKIIHAGNGNDILVSGKGDDVLDGGSGYNSYIFFKGAGKDTVIYDDNNTLSFDKISFVDVDIDEVVFYQQGDDLVIRYGSSDEVTIQDALIPSYKQVIFNFNGQGLFLSQIIDMPLKNILTDDNSRIDGWQGADFITADDNNNQIYSDGGDDHINAKKGDDYISGGSGNNTYVFNAGDGKDVISYDATGTDIDTVLLEDIQSTDIVLIKSNNSPNNLVLKYSDSDQITLIGALDTSSTKVVNFKFADTEIALADLLLQPISNENMENGSEYIYGWRGADSLVGDDESNAIYGYGGNDTLTGGAGNDYLDGGSDNNTYVINVGDGLDTISFDYKETDAEDTIILNGVNSDDISLYRQDDNLFIQYGDEVDNNSIILNDALSTEVSKSVQIQLDDKTVSLTELLEMPLKNIDSITNESLSNPTLENINGWRGEDNILGNDSDNQIFAYDGKDTLTGGKGNDILKGGAGADTYYISSGDGLDTIVEDSYANETSKVVFTDINPDDIQAITFEGDDLVIQYSETDKLTLQGYIANTLDSDLILEFADGSQWSNNDLMAKVTFEGTNEEDTITGTLIHRENIINGHDGDDTIQGNEIAQNIIDGGAGWDEINGGANIDSIHGGTGEDFIHGEAGADKIYGEADHDTLFGGDGDDHIEGGDGHDWLQGDAGADTLIGGKGNDSYDVDKFDTFTENADEGYDAIFIADDFDVEGTNLEEIHLKGDGDYKATGDAGDNGLYGNSGNNRLDGETGADIMSGGGGDDYYIVDQYETLVTNEDGITEMKLGDQVVEGIIGNENTVHGDTGGIDTVEQWDDHRFYSQDNNSENLIDTGKYHHLQDNVENVILKGEAKIAFGNELDNIITLNEQSNFVNSLGGDDTIIYSKGGGQDSISVTDDITANDTLVIEGYTQEQTSFTREDDNLLIRFDNSDEHIFINDYFVNTTDNQIDNKIDTVIFRNTINDELEEVTLTQQEIDESVISRTDNHAPEVNNYPQSISVEEGNSINVQFSRDAVVDQDEWDSELDYSIITQDKQPLPDWLSFDPETMTLTGTPNSNQIGTHTFFLMGADLFGDSQGPGFTITVNSSDNNNPTDPEDFTNVVDGTDGNEQLVGTAENDILNGLGGNDQIFGHTGSDQLNGGSGNDYLAGGLGQGTGSGHDTLNGEGGDDTLYGEDGNDTLIGGSGDDTYTYKANDGRDTIDNTGGGKDRIFFDSIDESQLSYHQDGDDLVIMVDGDTNQQVRVLDHFVNDEMAIDYIVPSNGYVISASTIEQNLTPMPDSETGSDTTDPDDGNGSDNSNPDNSNDDNPTDLSGDNTITDTLSNDILEGGAGNDTYIYTGGQDVLTDTQGVDKLVFSNGITFNQVASGLMKSGDDLVLKVNGSISNQVTLTNYFTDYDSIIETIEFEDGSSFSHEQVFNLFGIAIPESIVDDTTDDSDIVDTDSSNSDLIGTASNDDLQGTTSNERLQGLLGDDTLDGQAGDDIIVGGKGNDTLIGGEGNDLYYIEEGFGNDTIINTGGGIDNIYFDGLSFNDVTQGLTKSGDDLILNISNSIDSLTLQDFFTGGENTELNISFDSSSYSLSVDQLLGAFSISKPDSNNTHSQTEYQSSLGTMLDMMDDFNANSSGDSSII